MKMNHLRMGIGMLVVLALLVILWPREETAGESGASVGTRERGGREGLVETPEGPRSGAGRGMTEREAIPLTEHDVDQMGDFMLPLVEGREVSLKGAIRILTAAYKDACRQSRTKGLVFEFDVPEGDERISFSIEQGNFEEVLKLIARLAGYEVVGDGLVVSFEALPAVDEGVTRTFRVSPDFRTKLGDELRRLGMVPSDDPGEMLEAMGVVRDGGKVTFSQNEAVLTVQGSGADLARVEAKIFDRKPIQLKATMKLIHADEALDEEVVAARGAELLDRVQGLAGKEGVEVMTMPSVTMRQQQEADIEVINTHPEGWTGQRMNLEGELMGLSILSRDTVEYRPEGHPQPYAQDTVYGVFNDGEAQISLVDARDGEFLYRVLTLEMIDATGRPIRGGGAGGDGAPFHVAKAVPGKEGFVFSPFNNKLVDVRNIPPGTLVADPTYPVSEKKFFRVP